MKINLLYIRIIKFLYKGLGVETVIDRFPIAEIIEHDEKGWLIKAEVYGDGVDIWFGGQGGLLKS